MRVGVAFPTTEIGNDPDAIRAFAAGVEGLDYAHLTCIDHVVQGARAAAGDWRSYYTLENAFHEVMVLLGFLAAATIRIELATAILVLPQRPTVLAAKQLAELDVLSAGRVRAGVGIGWNALEFEALGQPFATRARRIEEQVALMRRLWTERSVTFAGEFDRVVDAGINPRPVQRPIPVWIGAFAPAAIRRAGRIADGLVFNPRAGPDERARADLAAFREAAVAAGRDPAALGLDVTVLTAGREPSELRDEAGAWSELGATHLTVRTMSAGFGADVGVHLHALETARGALSDV